MRPDRRVRVRSDALNSHGSVYGLGANCKGESSVRLRDISGTLNVSPGIINLGG